jgi:hypothetical protein
MERHWVETLGNASNENLRELWVGMEHVFGQAIISSEKPEDNLWRVLQPPTGTGKTQGLCAYCSIVAKANDKAAEKEGLGILTVTRLIAQCDEITETINALACRSAALARHSEADVTRDQVKYVEILVVKHAAYTKAVEALTKSQAFRWASLTNFGSPGEQRSAAARLPRSGENCR